MKLRLSILILLTSILSACNFSLAEDITPPPDYVPPTPMPTLGPLYPAQAPNIENGAAIYAKKCIECHGSTGMGDGEKGKQLPVTVAALGLPQVGQGAKPSAWYTIVSRGNIERFMPPFNSLTEQERWDVISYALTLHTDEKSLARGKELFDTFCADCPAELFRNQEWMASRSNMEFAQILKDGNADIPALGEKMTEDELIKLAAYIRTLSFAAPTPTPGPSAPAPTDAAPEATPSAGTTPLATESAAPSTPEVTGGKVTGSVSGEDVADLKIVLHGFDHASDGTDGPQEILTLETEADADGNFLFENIEMPEGRIFYVDADYDGVTYNSDLVTAPADAAEVSLPSFKIYRATTDYSGLVFDQVHYFIDAADGTVQALGVYTFLNAGEETIVINTPADVPFIQFPANAQNIGYERTQDSAAFMAAEDGFAIPPSETPYGLVAFYTMPYEGKLTIVQPFLQPVSSVLMLAPDGMKVKSDQLTEGGLQNFQDSNYREYRSGALQGGESLTFILSGSPKQGGKTQASTQQNILIGISALGGVLILAGAWMYLRDRGRVEEEEEEESEEYESEEEILDAIIALDDLHRAGKINNEAYRARREELKARLKG